jgi:diaminohydroxyphosphoribosylaminopyrimidine deaminase/5-amino-6-(5-phosphoribosylamino)uracil reductase
VAALPGKDGRVDLAELMRELGRRGINELHVEAGATLNGALVQAGLADELLMYLAPVLIGPGRPLLELPALDDLSAARRLQVHELSRVGADIRLIARFSN